MRYELKSIGIWSLVKISFFLNLIFGIIIGFFCAFFMGLFLSIVGNSPLADEWGMGSNDMSIGLLFIIFPLIFGIMGAFFQTLLVTLIVALYNLITKMTGGLVLNLATIDAPADQVVSQRSVVSSPSTVTPQPAVPPRAVVAPPPRPVIKKAEATAPVSLTLKPEAPTEADAIQPEPIQPEPTKPKPISDSGQADEDARPNDKNDSPSE